MSDANDVGARDTTQDLQQTLNLIIKREEKVQIISWEEQPMQKKIQLLWLKTNQAKNNNQKAS